MHFSHSRRVLLHFIDFIPNMIPLIFALNECRLEMWMPNINVLCSHPIYSDCILGFDFWNNSWLSLKRITNIHANVFCLCVCPLHGPVHAVREPKTCTKYCSHIIDREWKCDSFIIRNYVIVKFVFGIQLITGVQ